VKLLALVVLSCCLSTPDSCDMDAKAKADQAAADQRRATAPAPKPITRVCSVDQRFERTEVYPITMRADIALASCTGQLCRTWNWSSKNPSNAWAVYQDLPLCSSLPNEITVP
jgi:hypothetical protein